MTPEELSKELAKQNPPEAPVRECTQIIEWKYRNDKQATATCLEYFPTTFVEGKMGTDDTKIECTVSQQFECNYLRNYVQSPTSGPISMFDKCYTFSHKEVTMDEYLNTKRGDYCNEGAKGGESGGIPVFLTMTQAKHIAMGAHRENIFKMWVNVNYEGRTIEDSGTFHKGDLLYKEQWQVNNDYYWKGDALVKIEKDDKDEDGKPTIEFLEDAKNTVKNKIEYLFFRTRTDYVRNLMQGSFERATDKATARIVCEYRAKTIPEQEKYCNMLQKLGLNAKYDDGTTQGSTRRDSLKTDYELLVKYEGIGGRKRCVYTSLTTFSLDGTVDAIKAFKGCNEKPSKEHSSGLDDGKAVNTLYNALTKDGSYRFAAIKANTKIPDAGNHAKYSNSVLKHCAGGSPDNYQREHYDTYSHFYERGYIVSVGAIFADGYPKDECSDFPSPAMDSKALAMKKGGIIDVPVPVRLPALCSIATNVDCALNKNMCARDDQICEDINEWNEKTGYYAKCVCPKFHEDKGGVCTWGETEKDEGARDSVKPLATSCGMIMRREGYIWVNVPDGGLEIDAKLAGSDFDEEVVRVAVRDKCKMTVWAHHQNNLPSGLQNVPLLKDLTKGEHIVPNCYANTLYGWERDMSASYISCSCNPKASALPYT